MNMKKALEFSRSLQKTTRGIVYVGMACAIFLMISGYIITQVYGNFNYNFSFFAGEELFECGKSFIVCTFAVATVSEICLRRVHNEEK